MNLLPLRSDHVCSEHGRFSSDGSSKHRLLLILLSDRPKLFLFLEGNDSFSTTSVEIFFNNPQKRPPSVSCLGLAISCSESQCRIIWVKAKRCFVLKMCISSLIHAFHAKVAQQLRTFITVMWVTASSTRELIRARDFGHNQIDVQMVIGNSTIIGSAQRCNAFWFCYLNAICLTIWRKNIGLLEETKQDYVALSKASTDEFLWRAEWESEPWEIKKQV